MTVFFHNKEPIDLNAIAIMGVSVKTGDNPIGYFGTGLKFAIATLLRTGHKIHLHVSDECIEFTARAQTIRGEAFEVVYMNEQALGFTTMLGRNWEPWQAYREIYCNCTDERGVISTEIPAGEWGTAFAVQGEAIEKCHRERAGIFLQGSPLHTVGDVEIHEGSSPVGFYRGVRAHDHNAQSLFTYNVKSALTLTEDRTIKDHTEWAGRIALAVNGLDDEDTIQEILLAPEGTLESRFDLDRYTRPSDAFMAVAGRLRHNALCNRTAQKAWERFTPKSIDYVEVSIDAYEERQLESAYVLLQRVGCPISRTEFSIVEGMGENIYGLAQGGKIKISKRCFDKGTRFVASTLYEEWLHVNHQYEDCTRDLQNLLFDKLFSMVERVVGTETASQEREFA